MKKSISVTIVIAVAILDVLSSTLVYILLAENKQQIHNEMFGFEFGGSTFDLLLVSIFRFCILFGASAGILFNNIHAVQRVKKTSKFIIYLSCFITIYGILKILYFTEDNHQKMDVRVWIMIGLSLVSSITVKYCWKLLAASKCSLHRRNINGTESEDGSYEEKEKWKSSGRRQGRGAGKENNNKLNKHDQKETEKYTTHETVIKLFKLAKNDTPYIFLAFLFLTVASIAQAFLPYYTGCVLNYIVIEKSEAKFKTAMLYMALITILASFAAGIRGGLFTFILARYVLRLQNLLLSSILNMEIGFFDIRKTGEITSRLTSDCTKIGDSVGLNMNVFLRNVVKIVGVFFFMLKLSWKLSIVTLFSFPVMAIFSELFGDKFSKIQDKVQSSLAHANESAEEAISSIRTVRSFAAEKNEIDRYAKRLQVTYDLRKKKAFVRCGYRWSTELSHLAVSVLVLYFGGHLVIKNDLSGGDLISFILYSLELGFCIEEISNNYTGLMEAVGASKNVLVYIQRKPCVENLGNKAPEAGINGSVNFRNVSFSYPSRSDIPVLKNLNFSAKKGEIVALVGPSGGGKSSIINLLEHFYEPTEGDILVDNVNLREYDHKFIHEKMSIVQQEPALFARSISENIAYGLRFDATIDMIKDSAQMANAATFIEEFPECYDTETGEKGIQLSGGQKQRVAIARALIRNPSILILDEATSALDSESEYLVQQAINKNLIGRTVIVIAHRLSTIEKADKIFVIDKGMIIEQGNHLELMEKSDLYSRLVKHQLLGDDRKSCD